MRSSGVTYWWYFLCAIATLNTLAWIASAATLRQHEPLLSREAYIFCRRQLVLSAVYVFGCAFRSAHPVYDIPRLCLFHGWLSSVIVGRSVATVAELSFVTQWALLLRQCAGSAWISAKLIPVSIVVLIAIAEVCSWYSVITTSNVGHVIEETIWGTSAALAVLGVGLMRAAFTGARRRMLIAWCIAGTAYVAYMFLRDVPMYWSRWVADEERGRHYLSIAQGLLDISQHRVVSYRWEDWTSEIVWMTLYFSVAVWISISLVHASLREAKRQPIWRHSRPRTLV